MKFNIQMVDNTVSSEWWKTIIHHFIKVGDNFEIRCWKEETEEILQVKRYGKAIADGNEISIKGAFVDELLLELMEENPADKEIYNKMTKYFTINVKNELCDIWSCHYGTEMYIEIRPAQSFGSWITYRLSKNHVCSTESFVKFISFLIKPLGVGQG